jgi:hypothetical protein
MLNWKEFGRKRSWPILIFYTRIWLEKLNKTTTSFWGQPTAGQKFDPRMSGIRRSSNDTTARCGNRVSFLLHKNHKYTAIRAPACVWLTIKDWKGDGRGLFESNISTITWPNLRKHVKMTRNLAEIRSGHLQNIRLEPYRLTNLPSRHPLPTLQFYIYNIPLNILQFIISTSFYIHMEALE